MHHRHSALQTGTLHYRRSRRAIADEPGPFEFGPVRRANAWFSDRPGPVHVQDLLKEYLLKDHDLLKDQGV